MAECRLFIRLLSHGIVSTTLVDTPWSLNVASPAKSPSSFPETMHTLSIFCLVKPFRQVWHSSSRPKSLFLIFPPVVSALFGQRLLVCAANGQFKILSVPHTAPRPHSPIRAIYHLSRVSARSPPNTSSSL